MTELQTDAGPVFAALADPTRRQIVDWLAAGGNGTATEFAARLPISRQAVVKHLAELAQAGIIIGAKRGREMRYRLQPRVLSAAADWLTDRADRWDQALHRLARHVEASEPGEDGDP